jgi:hypothetical protein
MIWQKNKKINGYHRIQEIKIKEERQQAPVGTHKGPNSAISIERK